MVMSQTQPTRKTTQLDPTELGFGVQTIIHKPQKLNFHQKQPQINI